jgi:hypothetical protein
MNAAAPPRLSPVALLPIIYPAGTNSLAPSIFSSSISSLAANSELQWPNRTRTTSTPPPVPPPPPSRRTAPRVSVPSTARSRSLCSNVSGSGPRLHHNPSVQRIIHQPGNTSTPAVKHSFSPAPLRASQTIESRCTYRKRRWSPCRREQRLGSCSLISLLLRRAIRERCVGRCWGYFGNSSLYGVAVLRRLLGQPLLLSRLSWAHL